MTVEAENPTEAKLTCAHRWGIEEANGPISLGICKKCGTQRNFQNYQPDNSSWDNTGLDRWEPNPAILRKNGLYLGTETRKDY